MRCDVVGEAEPATGLGLAGYRARRDRLRRERRRCQGSRPRLRSLSERDHETVVAASAMMLASAITGRVVRCRRPLSPGSLSSRSCMIDAGDNVTRGTRGRLGPPAGHDRRRGATANAIVALRADIRVTTFTITAAAST